MDAKIKILLCAAGVLALGGCTQGSMREFYSEAGIEVDEGGFGNPTMNNILAHTRAACAGMPKGYIVPDPIVVLDPGSPVHHPRYLRAHARCSGNLDGKYAQVIYRGYVASAAERTTVTASDAAAE